MRYKTEFHLQLLISMALYLQKGLVLLCFVHLIQSSNVTYKEYANHYNFLFNNYRSSQERNVARSIIYIEQLFNPKLTKQVGTINMFIYSCLYWRDRQISKWNTTTGFKLKYFTFIYKKDKCPLKMPNVKSSTPDTFVTVRNDGIVFVCPHTSVMSYCIHEESTFYPNDEYSCKYRPMLTTTTSWSFECGSSEDFRSSIRLDQKENCRKLNTQLYVQHLDYIDISNNNWLVKSITISNYNHDMFLLITLRRNGSSQYLNDVMVAITLGIISSSILLISLMNKVRIFLAIFLVFGSNVWMRFGLAEQAFIQFSLNENLIRYYQVVLLVQLITLALSCGNCMIVSKLYAHVHPPQMLIRLCEFMSAIGRIDPIFKKNIYFLDGIPLNVEYNDEKSDQSSAILDHSKIGWKEITLILDRLFFIILLFLVLVMGVILLK